MGWQISYHKDFSRGCLIECCALCLHTSSIAEHMIRAISGAKLGCSNPFKLLMCSFSLGVKTIGRWLPQKNQITPLFSFAHRIVCSPPINISYLSTISTLNRNFRPSIMSQNTSVTFGDGNTNCGNIDNSVNTTIYNSDEDAKIMHWLSPLEPESRHHTVRADRFEGVGNWLLEKSEFRELRGGGGGSDKAVLFCSGDPGVGKTHLR